MRISGGTVGGRMLKVPKGLGVRPTPDRVRQAIFNSLGGFVEETRVLELFGGSGALSLECLSRGAQSAFCIELSPKHAAFIRSNAAELGFLGNRFTVRVQNVFPALAHLSANQETFDLVVADPPFGDKVVGARSKSLSQQVLDDPNLPKLMAAGSKLVLGHAKRDPVEVPPNWEEHKVLNHGDSVFRMLTLITSAQEQPLLEPGV